MAGFGRLRHELAAVRDINTFDAVSLLSPFLQIVQTKGTAAPITILTLGALRKFLAYGFIGPTSPRFPLAMQSLSAAVTRCQFDTSDAGQVEVVLLMILHLMEDMMSGPGGDILSDESVCDMMGRGLAICSQPRFSPVLRRTAESAMVHMCQIIFEDVKHLELEAGVDPDALDRQTDGDMDNVTMDPAPAGINGDSLSVAQVDNTRPSTSSEITDPKESLEANDASEDSEMNPEEPNDVESLDLRPYSLPSVRELFRVLVNFLDPTDRQHTDTMRVMALRIIHVALEVSGPSIARHPALATIAEDQRLELQPASEDLPSADHLREQRRRKKIIIKGTTKFNETPKGGLAYLQAQGIIDDAQNVTSVARFLHATSRVNKKVLGEYLSKKGNEPVLEAYLDLFDFDGKRVDEALRVLLETFRLPGEAPLIERIVTVFADRYCANATPTEVANQDAVFVLTYAIILLNTDQHNPTVKKTSKRMTLEDFSKNLRGVNDGGNFAPEYLQEIFNSIRNNEIILPEEHDNKHAFDYAWRELLAKTEIVGPLVLCDTNIYDADIFATTWRPIVSTLSYVFMSATDDAVFARIVTGFDECARIATKFGNSEALDQIVYSLSHMTTLATDLPFSTNLNTEVQAGNNTVMVSELAVKLGRDFRAQLATLVLFRVVTGSESHIHKGWRHVIRIWLNLFVNSLMPAPSVADSTLAVIPAIPLQTPSQVIDRASKTAETGFFSAFTSYISSYAADDPPEPSDEELESTLCSVDCVNSCHMATVFANITELGASELAHLVDGLISSLPEEQNPAVITVKSDHVPPATQLEPKLGTLSYDPAMVFSLEMMAGLALRDEATLQVLGKQVMDTLQAILRDANQYHAMIVSRTSFYLLTLLHATHLQTLDYVNIPVLLHTISNFPKETLAKSSVMLIQGLKLCVVEPGPLRNEIMTSPDFWSIMRALAGRYDSAAVVFDLLERGCTGVPPAIMADNYEAALLLLGDFASAAGRAVLAERKQEQRPRKSRDSEREPPSDHQEWTAIFGEVLFPLIHRLLKPEVFTSDRDGMGEMRVQSSSLLCKVFLQYLVLLSTWDGMLDLWLEIIDIMDRLINSGQGDSLEEAVRENLKNVILFMSSSGFLVAPSQDASKETLWSETWNRIDRFVPDLKRDLALDEPRADGGDEEAAVAASTAEQNSDNSQA
ncbi:hypothetical protein ACHAO3_005827 [Verticillium nonalfalfae]